MFWKNTRLSLPAIGSTIIATIGPEYYAGIVMLEFNELSLSGISLTTGATVCIPVNSLDFWDNTSAFTTTETHCGIFPGESLLQCLLRNRTPIGAFLTQWDVYLASGIDPTESIFMDFFLSRDRIPYPMIYDLQAVRDYYLEHPDEFCLKEDLYGNRKRT